MKTFTTLFVLSLLFCLSIHAQNWQLINPNYAYHFVKNGDLSDSLQAITVRAIGVNGLDYALNLSIEFADPIWQDDSYINLPSFMQKQVVHQANGKKWFHDPKSFVLFESNPPQTWLFDTLASIQAEVIQLYEAEIYGQTDSFRAIRLSTSDTIIQSKGFGLVQFPDLENAGEYYQQIGVKGPDAGFQFPDIDMFFDFTIGDKFEYFIFEEEENQGAQENSETVTTKIIKQIEIVDIITQSSGEKLFIINESKSTESLTYNHWIQSFTDSSRSVEKDIPSSFSIEPVPYLNWDNMNASSDIWDTYPGEFFWYRNPYSEYLIASVSYQNINRCGPRITRILDLNKCFVYEFDIDGDKTTNVECQSGAGWSGYAEWTTGLGVTSVRTDIYDVWNYFSYNYSQDLVAFTQNGDTCGEFSSLEFEDPGVDPDTTNNEPGNDTTQTDHKYIYPFINPVSESIQVYPDSDYPFIVFSMIDMAGREVLSQDISGEEPVLVDVSGLARGLFIARILGPNGEKLIWYRLVVR